MTNEVISAIGGILTGVCLVWIGIDQFRMQKRIKQLERDVAKYMFRH